MNEHFCLFFFFFTKAHSLLKEEPNISGLLAELDDRINNT